MAGTLILSLLFHEQQVLKGRWLTSEIQVSQDHWQPFPAKSGEFASQSNPTSLQCHTPLRLTAIQLRTRLDKRRRVL